MRVVHLMGDSLTGGAARGGYWLHLGLKSIGVRSVILSDSATRIGDPDVRYARLDPPAGFRVTARMLIERAPLRLYPRRHPSLFSPGIAGYRFDRHPDVQSADVLHLHWVNGAFVDVRDLARVRKPIVWTLRDMWPITGGCHYTMGCERFAFGCGECPQLGSGRLHDLSWWCARRKLRSTPRDTVFVAQTRWMADEARRSAIVAGRDVVTIGNTVNCQDFFPISREAARRSLGMRIDAKKVLLAGAQDLTSFYKGFDALIAALDHLDRDTHFILLFGRGGADRIEKLGFEVKDLGFLTDTAALRAAYCAADVFVAPSRMEAFGKTIAEAMACGRPVVCFDATGPRDIVDHEVNGYRAAPFEAAGLAAGIEWVTADVGRWGALSNAARAKIERSFDSVVVARRYADLYASVVAAGRGGAAGTPRRWSPDGSA